MKRVYALILALACCLSLFGCKQQEKPAPTQATTEATTETTAQTEAPTEAPATAPTQKPTKATKATTKATEPINKRPAAATKASAGVTTKATKAPTKATVTATVQTVMEATEAHEHTFGEWVLQEASTCVVAGKELRRCSQCEFAEIRDLPMEEHSLSAGNVCKTCRQVIFDDNAPLVELGVVCDAWYGVGADANFAWDIKYWKGKIYRGAGDYDKNSGSTIIMAYNIEKHIWENTGSVSDEAVHSFIEIGGTLYVPGIDPREGWEQGNFYVLQEDGKWKQVRNLKNGIHNFDMIECGGKIFAGLGTETVGQTVAVSEDGGKTFKFVPLYKDGKLMDLSGYKSSRTYEFVKYNGEVYALVRFTLGFGGEWAVFRYADGKMHYLTNGVKLLGSSTSRKYFGGEFEFDGACYIATGGLTVVTDFANQENWKQIPMPGGETVVDAFLRDGVIYTLAYAQNRNPSTHNVESYRTAIYKSTTGKEGSFQEVLSFDYTNTPMSFDWDGKHFYIGTGPGKESAKVGMILRATPAA
ncbi:MAG: hypothetical protein IJ403_04535 [Oscillospiraceae bacterium]|nr:hypothetical protein [Oscillospiraceae bacterium]